ncbi:MAG: EamA family transporter [Rhodothermales bacterium]
MDSSTTPPARWALVLALGSVYFIWGSTYLAIRYAVETMPPLLLLGTRFGIAGALLYVWLRLRGSEAGSFSQWRTATLVGTLMLGFGTGTVAWSTQYIPSGLAALLITTVPMWMALLDWIWKKGTPPNTLTVVGFIVGGIGVALLFDTRTILNGDSVNLMGALATLVGAVCWSVGSLHGRSGGLPSDPFLSTAMQMLGGGAMLTLAGIVSGELADVHVASFTVRSLVSWAYLLFFGSLIGFSAYVWLLKHTTAAVATTYAYVNPGVAILLGWLIGGERVTWRMGMALVLLVTAVAIINLFGRRRPKPVTLPPNPSAALPDEESD